MNNNFRQLIEETRVARPFNQTVDIALAMEILAKPGSIEQLKQVQAVLLPLRFGLTLTQTAEALGLSRAWTSRLRNGFIRKGVSTTQGRVGRGRRRLFQSPQVEENLVAQYLRAYQSNSPLTAKDFKGLVEKTCGKPVALSTVYNLLERHGIQRGKRAR